MSPRFTSLLACLAACHAPLWAAEEETTLPEIVVTSNRNLPLDSGSTTLGPDEIAPKRAMTSDTTRLLLGIPGVATFTAGGVSSLPTIHGLADDRLRTEVDGVGLIAACPNHMNSPLSYIDPTAVEHIQVYTGVAPVSQGGDSIGGSILVESAAPAFAEPGERLFTGTMGLFYRSNGNAWGGNLGATVASDRFSINYTGSYAQSDNYKAADDFKDYEFTGRIGQTLPLDEVGSTAYVSTNQSLTAAWQGEGQSASLSWGYQHIPYEYWPNQRMDMTDNLSNQFRLKYSLDMSWGTLDALAYYEHTEHKMDFGEDKRFWYGPGMPPKGSGGSMAVNGTPCSPLSGTRMVNGKTVGCAAGMPMDTDAKNKGVTLSAEIPVGEADLVRIGAEYHSYTLDDWWDPSGAGMWPYTFWNVNDGERSRLAAYGEWEISLDRWTHVLGLRLESVHMNAGPVHGYNLDTYPTTGTGGLGNQTRDAALFNAQSRDKTDLNLDLAWNARFEADATQTYELALARKNRSPNVYERYPWSTWQMAAFMNNFVGDGNGYVGNLDLDPETSYTATVSGDWHDADKARWGLRITPYYSYVQNYIDAVQWDPATNAPRKVPVVDDFTVLKYFNQSAELYGVDLAASYLVAGNTAYGDFTVKAIASYTRGKNRDTGDNLYNIMPLNGTVYLIQDMGPWHNSIEVEMANPKEDVSQVRNEIKTPGYGLLHLRGRYEQPTWSIEVGIENLLDQDYDLPLGGAYVGQGTTMTIPPEPNEPQWGTAVPGPGRTFYAGVNIRF